MSRIAIVGVEGSGKTVLMAALGDKYGKPSPESLYLMPENQAAFTFMTQIPHKMREEHKWPAATAIQSMKHLKWTLRIGTKVMSEITMLDYPGELYRHAFGDRNEEDIAPHREQIHEFLEHLVTADALIVLFNLKDATEIGANARSTETVWLTRSIFDYAKKLPNIKNQLLLFTQADRYYDELKSIGGVGIAKEKYLPMLHLLYPDLECATVFITTDDSDAPSREFSQSHGITEMMRWVVLQTEEGKRVDGIIKECMAVLNDENPSVHNIQVVEQKLTLLYADSKYIVNTLDANYEDMMKSLIDKLNSQLKYEEEKAREASIKSAVVEVLKAAEKVDKTHDLDDLKRSICVYNNCITSLSQTNYDSLNDSDIAFLHHHQTACKRYNSFVDCANEIIRSRSLRMLTKNQTWQIVRQKYPEPLFQRVIEHAQEWYANEAKEARIRSYFYLSFAIVIGLAVMLATLTWLDIKHTQPTKTTDIQQRVTKIPEAKINVASPSTLRTDSITTKPAPIQHNPKATDNARQQIVVDYIMYIYGGKDYSGFDVATVFDTETIKNKIFAEHKRRNISVPIDTEYVQKYIDKTINTMAPESVVEVVKLETHSNGNECQVDVIFKSSPTSSGMTEEGKETIRQSYKLVPNVGEIWHKEKPSIPISAFESADTLIAYIEKEGKKGEFNHYYQFVFDPISNKIIDWKKEITAGKAPRSAFMELINNLENVSKSAK